MEELKAVSAHVGLTPSRAASAILSAARSIWSI
jgi:hypothetical protein